MTYLKLPKRQLEIISSLLENPLYLPLARYQSIINLIHTTMKQKDLLHTSEFYEREPTVKTAATTKEDKHTCLYAYIYTHI